MKIFVLAAALVSLSAGAALAAAPTPEQKVAFLKACEKYGSTEMCTCKAEQAMKLVDSDFMKVVIDSINGKTTPVEDTQKYAVYIGKSNKVCAPGM